MDDVKFQHKYRIPSARASWHDYSGGMYFVTVCTHHFVNYFGEIKNGKLVLNELGKYVGECIEKTPCHFPDVEIPSFVVMPNHFHAIVCVNCDSPHSKDAACHVSTIPEGEKINMQIIAKKCGRLSAAIGGIKSAVTRFAHKKVSHSNGKPVFTIVLSVIRMNATKLPITSTIIPKHG